MKVGPTSRQWSATGAGAGPTGARLAWLAVLLLNGAAAAQPRVDLNIGGPERLAREAIQVKLVISNFSKADEPIFPRIVGASSRLISGPSDSTSITIVNGEMARRVERRYVWELIADQPGELTIPPIEVVADGQPVRTRASRIMVKPAGEELVIAEIACDREKLYVGQSARFTLRIWIKPARVNNHSLDADTMLRILKQSPAQLAPFTHLTDSRVVSRIGADGKPAQFYLYELEKDVICEQPGRPPVQDVVVGYNYPIQFSQDVFGDLVARRSRSLRITPTVTAPDVLALPSEGRPANFSGAVGRFSLRAGASPTRVRVGDPIELTLAIAGDGLMDSLPPPPLAAQPELESNFRVPRETLAGRVEGNRKVFQQTLRARSAEVRLIPAIEYVYFDPYRGEYAVAHSEPIDLSVSASAEFVDAEITGGATPIAGSRPSAQAADGLRGNELNEGVLLRRQGSISMPALAVAAVAPPAAYLIAGAIVAASKRRGGSARRRASAASNAHSRLDSAAKSAGVSREVEAAICGYLADRFDQPPAKFVGPAAAEFLRQRGASPALVAQCRLLIERCQAAAYAGGASDGALTADATRLIEQLERTPL